MMALTGLVLGLCFATFFVFWAVTAFTTKRTVARRRGWGVPFLILTLVYMVVRMSLWRVPGVDGPLYQRTLLTGLAGDAVALAGLAVMLWARVTLGGNWSAGVVLKENHELVTRGPYRFVRHPIYSGMLLMFLGFAVWRGRLGSFWGLLAILLLLWIKARSEEQLMIDTFGDAYRNYRARVKALVPYVF